MDEKQPPVGGGDAIASVHETSVAAVAAQAKAQVEARFLVAISRPRDIDVVREKILKDCERPRFAEVVQYAKPMGKNEDGSTKYIKGPSVRFAEAGARAFGNIDSMIPTLYDSEEKVICRVTTTDLESNVTFSQDVTVRKTVERRYLKKGQVAIKSRTNSYGQTVHIVEANDDDILNKQNALNSKALRNCLLRLLPGDIVEESVDTALKTLRNQDAKDPDEARKRIADAFASINVPVAELKEYLGHELSSSSPAELETLRGFYTSVRDGETTWGQIMSQHRAAKKESAPDETPQSRSEKMKADIASKANTDKPATEPEPPRSSSPVGPGAFASDDTEKTPLTGPKAARKAAEAERDIAAREKAAEPAQDKPAEQAPLNFDPATGEVHPDAEPSDRDLGIDKPPEGDDK